MRIHHDLVQIVWRYIYMHVSTNAFYDTSSSIFREIDRSSRWIRYSCKEDHSHVSRGIIAIYFLNKAATRAHYHPLCNK